MTTKRSIDPSHTALLRRKCVADMKKRCKLLMKDVQNLFSNKNLPISNIDQDEFRFATSSNKVKMFRQWLKEQVDKNILAVVGGPRSKVWLASYVESAWKKGLLRSYSTVHRAATTGVNWFGGAQAQFVKDVLNNPNVVSQLELLFTRSFNLLEGVTNEMSNQMSMILADGLANRWSVTRIANEMSRKITTLTNKRALLIAQTEIVRAQAEGQLDGMELLGISEVEAEVELVTQGDTHVCSTCRDLEGTRYTIVEARGVIPVHSNCFISPKVPVYTSKGWKNIGDIQIGDLVLTHKGRFRHVTELHRNGSENVSVVHFEIGNANRCITITANHPILTDKGWVEAKDLQEGSYVGWLSSTCKGCGNPIPEDTIYCNQFCQWKNLEHRENVRQKNRKAILEQYASGARDPIKIIENAHIRNKELIASGQYVFQRIAKFHTGENNNACKPEARKKISDSKKGDKNPMRRYPELGLKHSKMMKQLLKEHPEKRLNVLLAHKARKTTLDSMTKIEKLMAHAIEDMGLNGFVYQFPVGKLWLDFGNPECMVGVECDSERWHQNKDREIKRQKKLEDQGWTILHFIEEQINTNATECAKEIVRIINNHKKNYEFGFFPITKIRKYVSKNHKLYNLSVEEDASYVAKGCVVHNCRCAWSHVIPAFSKKARR